MRVFIKHCGRELYFTILSDEASDDVRTSLELAESQWSQALVNGRMNTGLESPKLDQIHLKNYQRLIFQSLDLARFNGYIRAK
jgi:hypothetical protein